MCGIAGFVSEERGGQTEILGAMLARIQLRGPDDQGLWCEEEVALGHRRLSILDLSPQGHQPMISQSGRYVISFNGEVYNYLEIQAQLAKTQRLKLRGHSDTEVMLAAIEAWGLEKAVASFRGMFAFALWDRREKTLSLARDRLGVKPLYYGWNQSTFFFASEIKALRPHPDFEAKIERDILALYFRTNYVPAPYSIFAGIYKLPAATSLVLTLPELLSKPNTFSCHAGHGALSPQAYWSPLDYIAQDPNHQIPPMDSHEAVFELERLLKESVKLRMVADVPLGAFLSGGLDSSLIVALMQAQSTQPIRTFSIGFFEKGYNEAQHAKAVAEHLGTNHTELYLTADQAIDTVPELCHIYDEPFADSSQIPTLLVSRLARQAVTVSLSGDGGDELFAGYLRYEWARRFWRYLGPLPPAAKNIMAAALSLPSTNAWDRILALLNPLCAGKLSFQNAGTKVHKLSQVLRLKSRELLYDRLVTHWDNPYELVLDARPRETPGLEALSRKGLSFLQYMVCHDITHYLPDDILVKLDRATMAVSLEGREPLLDHKLAEFALGLPDNLKLKGGQAKWILRQVLYRYVPRGLVERPKMGFGIPLGSWLRGPLRDWAESLIDQKKLKQDAYLDAGLVQQTWREHLSAKHNWQYHLWDILSFQAWLASQR